MLHLPLALIFVYVTVLTSFYANDCPPEPQRDRETLPDVDDSVKQTILCVGVCNHPLLLLQRLHTNTHTLILHILQRPSRLSVFLHY